MWRNKLIQLSKYGVDSNAFFLIKAFFSFWFFLDYIGSSLCMESLMVTLESIQNGPFTCCILLFQFLLLVSLCLMSQTEEFRCFLWDLFASYYYGLRLIPFCLPLMLESCFASWTGWPRCGIDLIAGSNISRTDPNWTNTDARIWTPHQKLTLACYCGVKVSWFRLFAQYAGLAAL